MALDPFRRRQASPEAGDRDERNARRLAERATCGDPREQLRLRNAVVADNLPLVIHLARRWRRNCQLPFDDLVQVGSIGLIRAVEAFDPARRRRLSSFAVPYILGAMKHEVRDRQHLLRIPRLHWELHQRLARLQDDRRLQGLPALSPAELAEALGCREEELRQTMELPAVTRLRSLDAPVAGSADAGGTPCRLIDQLEHGAPPSVEDSPDPAASDLRRTWLREQLKQLDPVQRELLEGRLELGCTWVELGRSLGLTPRQAQRRYTALLDRLRQGAEEAAEGLQGETTPLRASPIARRAAMNV